LAYERIKTEHAGAKNGGGAWMTRAETKQIAKRQRRQADRQQARAATNADECGDLDEFSARGSMPTLRRLAENEAAAGFSWEEERRMESEEPEMAELPESWRTMPDGTQAPNWGSGSR
jgi:hypothetical protein